MCERIIVILSAAKDPFSLKQWGHGCFAALGMTLRGVTN
jgi:hypothetical protein